MGLQEQIVDWAASAFPEQDPEKTVFPKFLDEVDEFIEAFKAWCEDKTPENSQQAAWELADIGMMVYQLAEYLEADFNEETRRKLNVNKDRVWAKGEDGTYSHVPKEVVRAGSRN